MTADLRIPPVAIEAEQSVLGGLLISNAAFDRVGDVLVEADFYRAEHRLIYRAVTRLIASGKPADALTVTEFLRDHGKLVEGIDLAYIGSLGLNTLSAANIRHYAQIVANKSMLRRLIEQGQTIIEDCTVSHGGDPADRTHGVTHNRFLATHNRGPPIATYVDARPLRCCPRPDRNGNAKREPLP